MILYLNLLNLSIVTHEFFYCAHFCTFFHKSARPLLLFQILFRKLCTFSCMFFLQTLFSPFSPAPVAGESRVYWYPVIYQINQKLENPLFMELQNKIRAGIQKSLLLVWFCYIRSCYTPFSCSCLCIFFTIV